MDRPFAFLPLLVLLLAGARPGRAFPVAWAARQQARGGACDAHPSRGYGRHPRAEFDPAISFTVLDGSGAPVTAVCPGATYSVQVTFPQPRLAMLTAEAGTLQRRAAFGRVAGAADPACDSRWLPLPGEPPSRQVSAVWALACTRRKGTAALAVTSARGAAGSLRQAVGTLRVGGEADCGGAAARCGGAEAVTGNDWAQAASDEEAQATAASGSDGGQGGSDEGAPGRRKGRAIPEAGNGAAGAAAASGDADGLGPSADQATVLGPIPPFQSGESYDDFDPSTPPLPPSPPSPPPPPPFAQPSAAPAPAPPAAVVVVAPAGGRTAAPSPMPQAVQIWSPAPFSAPPSPSSLPLQQVSPSPSALPSPLPQPLPASSTSFPPLSEPQAAVAANPAATLAPGTASATDRPQQPEFQLVQITTARPPATAKESAAADGTLGGAVDEAAAGAAKGRAPIGSPRAGPAVRAHGALMLAVFGGLLPAAAALRSPLLGAAGAGQGALLALAAAAAAAAVCVLPAAYASGASASTGAGAAWALGGSCGGPPSSCRAALAHAAVGWLAAAAALVQLAAAAARCCCPRGEPGPDGSGGRGACPDGSRKGGGAGSATRGTSLASGVRRWAELLAFAFGAAAGLLGAARAEPRPAWLAPAAALPLIWLLVAGALDGVRRQMVRTHRL
ncbi:hypothetical protein Rsub_02187 [Raphidocelis subcapitata]|uniref:Pherophorin domain-containing protein n=1 Tax=Raphidocelis subcapitata TaxID=307507 RepID=A0A2V0NUR4_9CHLO|nr:hypothetical protein Rsub_02187 [Raphidocelis subcapitata]|eukprot:GBF89310.1 hypothetical protein Rsub_02187 [Raphidocelis subcapitata]